MTRTTAVLDRAVTLLLGAALIVLGVGFLLWWAEVDWVRDLVAHADRHRMATVARQQWWRWLLGTATVLLVVAGVGLLVANLRPRRAGSPELDGTTEFGTFTANVGQVAQASAALLARHHAVASATATTIVDLGRTAIRLTIVAEPDVTLDHLRRLAGESIRDIGTALAGTDVVVDIFVQAAPRRV